MAEITREISSVDQFIVLVRQAGIKGVELVDMKPDPRTGELISRYGVAEKIAREAEILEAVVAGFRGELKERTDMTKAQRNRLMGRRIKQVMTDFVERQKTYRNDPELAIAR